MTFLKAMLVLAFFVLGGYYLFHMDEVNDQASHGLKTSTDYFIDKSDQVITVIDLWANGPNQNFATSGSESIKFEDVDTSIVDDDAMILPPIVQPTQEERELKACEVNFKDCVDYAHEQYGVYIQVKEVRSFNDNLAKDFYNLYKSEYQPEFNDAIATYPLILVYSEAVGLGKFVAICKAGNYPDELNKGLPC